jgi:hypothetical protein
LNRPITLAARLRGPLEHWNCWSAFEYRSVSAILCGCVPWNGARLRPRSPTECLQYPGCQKWILHWNGPHGFVRKCWRTTRREKKRREEKSRRTWLKERE